jgi:hypothetical protein
MTAAIAIYYVFNTAFIASIGLLAVAAVTN